MATIVTRAGKGSPLTHAEVDANFVNLNTDKVDILDVGTAANQVPLNQYLGSFAYLDADNVSYSDRGINTAEQNLGVNRVSKVTISANTTLTTTIPNPGSFAFVIVVSSGATSRVVTFGTGFRPTSTLETGTTSGVEFVVMFVSDGTGLIEVSRSRF
jgi:hypothetical protein